MVALGSGALLDSGLHPLLDGLPVVYLATDFGTIARRLGLDRPRVVVPGNPRGRLRAMLEERRPLYERLATVTVQTDDDDPDELAEVIAAEIGDADDRDQDRRPPLRRPALPGGRRRRRAR